VAGVLLDSHALFWLVSGEEDLREEALVAIGESQARQELLVSPISSWELSVATQKGRVAGRPHLGDIPPDRWFRQAVALTDAKVVPIRQRIACEAASVVIATGHKDPGDCYLIATCRVKGAVLVTRDATILAIAAADPDYIGVVQC
jgi:PIN domain nuclease of toxin-antitoxin system